MIEYYEPFFELKLPTPEIKLEALPWVRYNPRKEVNRWGVSLTSLDGGISGVPDLDSLHEYNNQNQTQYTESHFTKPTPFFDKFSFLTESFDLGRSHILKLGSGGFFPYHRDPDPNTFRLMYTLEGCHESNFVFILNKQILKLEDRRWYYINTKMVHSVFSFFGSQFAVFNVITNEKAAQSIRDHVLVK